jgi:AhpD family alkylhydroperoxidase
MTTRGNPYASESLRKFTKYLISANQAVSDSTLPRPTQELVKIRASQINGCGGCLDMHTKEALLAGETPLRLNLIAAWRETSVFTDAERAALELTEHGTRMADGAGIPDAVWANAGQHFDDEQMGALVAQVAAINAFNRLNVMFGIPGGGYEPRHSGQETRAL